MQGDFSKVWNISGIVDDGRGVKLVNKTSNGLKCYNHHFNGIVPTAHPNLVQALWKEVDRVLARMEKIDKCRDNPQEYGEPIFPEIPSKFCEMIKIICGISATFFAIFVSWNFPQILKN